MGYIVKDYSIEEVYAMESHAELINNDLIVTDKTTVAHNNAVTEMVSALIQFIRENDGRCKVFSENVALYCDELCSTNGNFFLPDVMVVCDESGIEDDGIHTTPRFVAEVTSESTRKQDYGRKMVVYGDMGVQEYWVVDLQRKMVVRYIQEREFVPEIIPYPQISTLALFLFPKLEINLSRIFE